MTIRISRRGLLWSTAATLELAFGAGLLAGCAGTPTPKPPPVARTIKHPGRSTVTVSADDAGATIVLERSQHLVVRLVNDLKLRLEWSLVGPKPGVLDVGDKRFERLPRSVDDAETAGETVWELRPVAAGSVALSFEQRRPRSLDAPVRIVPFTVVVS